MPIAATPSDWCFDYIDITPFIPRRQKPAPQETKDELTPALILELIFHELCHETDRPVRDRINEALRQWRLRRIASREGRP